MHKILIITGGSRGIGESAIRAFLDNHWRVINISRTPCAIKEVEHVQLDLSSPVDIALSADVFKDILKQSAVISLVHNAGFYQRDSIANVSLPILQSTFAVNIISPMLLNTLIIPFMLPGSSIIYIGSTLAEKAVPNSASYTVSKHAIKGLMRATQQDLAEQGIQTCVINPGLVETALLKDTIPSDDLSWLLTNKVIGNRLIQPSEIANIIYFCATQTALNGAVIDANLGERAL